MSSEVFHQVAVGIVVNSEGKILISKRLSFKLEGGFWEFPGGKIESNETAIAALIRELQEEVGIRVLKFSPLVQYHHDYPKHSVLLQVFVVTHFEGEAKGLEGQEIHWVNESEFTNFNFLEANKKIIEIFLSRKYLSSSDANN